MADTDEERIRAKAHELWEAEGRPHGRDRDHWIQAREIIAIQDSEADTLLPATTGADETVESPDEALRNLADFPNLTDQGENLLTSTDREPPLTAASSAASGVVPAVEVPTSDQPGGAAAKTAETSAKQDMSSKDPTRAKPARKTAAEPAGKAAATKGKAAEPKVAAAAADNKSPKKKG